MVVYTSELYNPDDDTELGYGVWGDAVNWYPISKTFDVGDGFWFSPEKDGVTVCFPNPFYTAE